MKTSTPSAQRFSCSFAAILAVVAIASAPSATAQGTAFATLLEFVGSEGSLPASKRGFRLRGQSLRRSLGSGQTGTLCWFGGPYCHYGSTVFKLSKTSGGPWITTILHQFTGGSDGGNPRDGLIFDKAGNLCGTTYFGGLGAGVVFELSPTAYGKPGIGCPTLLAVLREGRDFDVSMLTAEPLN